MTATPTTAKTTTKITATMIVIVILITATLCAGALFSMLGCLLLLFTDVSQQHTFTTPQLHLATHYYRILGNTYTYP
eukprot:2133948-Amphidinium_carterae.1